MKKIWNVVAWLAVVNVLALGGLAGWLWASGRMSRERMQGLRALFAPTLEEEAQAKVTESARVEEERKAAIAAEKAGKPPVPATTTIEGNQREYERQFQITLRRQQEVETMRQTLAAQMTSLDQREKQLRADRDAFEAYRRRMVEVEGTGQFKAALETLEALKSKEAKLVLGALLRGGETEQVVSYLARMDESKRGKVLSEFVKEDAAVAAELLERLRTRGVGAPALTGSIAATTPGQHEADHLSPVAEPAER